MAFILGGTFKNLGHPTDWDGTLGVLRVDPEIYNCIFSTSGRKSKPEVGLPHTILVLFRHEILPNY